jgi:hypothetical protein
MDSPLAVQLSASTLAFDCHATSTMRIGACPRTYRIYTQAESQTKEGRDREREGRGLQTPQRRAREGWPKKGDGQQENERSKGDGEREENPHRCFRDEGPHSRDSISN